MKPGVNSVIDFPGFAVGILKTIETFTDFVTHEQPLMPPQLTEFTHYLFLNTLELSPGECIEKSLKFIEEPANAN